MNLPSFFFQKNVFFQDFLLPYFSDTITYFRKQCKRLIQNYGIWRGWKAVNVVCFERKMISRNGALNCSLSCETFPGKLYNSKVANCSFWLLFPVYSSAQPCPYQWSLKTVFKSCHSVRLREPSLTDIKTEQGKHLLPPPSDVFCGVCLKHITFANKSLWSSPSDFPARYGSVTVSWCYIQVTKPNALNQVPQRDFIPDKQHLKQPPASLSPQGLGEGPHSPEHPKWGFLCSPVWPSIAGPAWGISGLPGLCGSPAARSPLEKCKICR